LTGASLSRGETMPLLTARQSIELATVGGASVLGRADVGSLEVGKCADFISINLDRLDYSGALHDPVAAVVFCATQRVDYNVVAGKPIVKDGELLTLDVARQVKRHNLASKRLMETL
jgi:8-oxoguanine deaminase